jgi:hypothetical protein
MVATFSLLVLQQWPRSALGTSGAEGRKPAPINDNDQLSLIFHQTLQRTDEFA